MPTNKPEKESPTTQYLRLINDMLTDKTFDKSAEFLRKVRSSVQQSGKITSAQIQAVNNIYIKFSEKI